MDNHTPHYLDIGTEGEAFVAQWLQQQGWQILDQRWRCRWGELDLVAYQPANSGFLQPRAAGSANSALSVGEPTLAFVEVKTRSSGNWDGNGRFALTPQKQMKVTRAAQLYLATNPRYTDMACRFDVAIVLYQPRQASIDVRSQQLFQIQDYIVHAWEA